MLSYNRGYPDQYYQKYDYDADNRITQVQTSGDGLVWKRDASYIYYKHGPLARIELGDLNVQGVDFAYTLQGWLKLVNSDTLNPTLDMGRDGDSSIMAPDAVAMSIDYFKNDYTPITSYKAAHVDSLTKELFNGNISRQTSDSKFDNLHTTLLGTTTVREKLKRLSKQYIYDQLNRIHNAHYSYIDSANMLTATPEFKSTYAYDPDGNILSLTRNGSVKVGSPPGASILMDSLTYTYGNGYGGYSRNQLHCLNEDAPDLYANDIKYQHACDTAPPNYTYDAIGNTTMDLVSGQRDIKWNIYNKVVETINATDTVIMRFKYDGAGNRIAKYFMQRIGTDTNCKSDYYVRDAQGNILATYKDDFQYDGGGTLLSRKYHLAEHDIYGSSRLGVKNYWPSQHRWLWDNAMSEYDSLTINQRQPWYSLEYQDIIQKDSLDVYGSTHNGIWKSVGITGQKQYEITDHLGNVLSTVSDARGSDASHTSTDSFTITGYEPAIKSITDYYPFGMQMPDRCYSDGTTHVTNISAVTTVPVHHMVNRVWPDGRAVSILGASILPGPSPLALVASGAESLSYQLPRYIDGLLHTVRIFTHGTVPPGFRAEISIGGIGPTAFSGISTDLTYLSSSASVPYLHIYNLGMRDTIFIDSVHIDSATYEPYHVLSSISSSDGYAYGFNGKFKDNEWAGQGNHLDFGDRGLDCRIGRWNKVDSKQEKYPGYSPYHFGYDNPVITIDPDGKENIVVVGNQGHSPNSDFKNGRTKDGHRYGENKRHFLEAGLNEALRLKNFETDNGEGTAIVIYKGNYSAKELKQYRRTAEKAGISVLEVSSAKEVTNYINAKDINGDNLGDILFGSDRTDDKITDFSYVGHGWTKALYTGYNAVRDGVDADPLYTTTFQVNAFDLKCDVNLNACASGFDVMDDFVNRLTGGEVTGYKVTIQWGEKGLGSSKPFDKFYYPPGDPRRNSSERPTIPERDRTRTEQGNRSK